MEENLLLRILEKYGLITSKQAQQVEMLHRDYDATLGSQLIQSGILTEKQLYRFITERLEMNPATYSQAKNFSIQGKTLPRFKVSGDFYGFFPLNEGRVAITLSDVAGKGLEAGVLAIFLSDMLRSSIELKSLVPATIMRRINQFGLQFFKPDQFATFTVVILDMYSGTLEYSCAGTPPILHYRYKEKVVEELDVTGIPIGIDGDFNYAGSRRNLEKGDLLLFYTDGAYEAQNLMGSYYGLERIKASIAKNASRHPEKLVSGMVRSLRRFTMFRGLNDDTTYIAVKYNL